MIQRFIPLRHFSQRQLSAVRRTAVNYTSFFMTSRRRVKDDPLGFPP